MQRLPNSIPRYFGAFLLALLALAPVIDLKADDTKKTTAKKPAKKEEKKDEEPSAAVKSLSMLPIGKTNYGVKLPEYKDGRLQSLVVAGKLTPVDKERIFLEDVRIQTMDADGETEMEILMITGSFDVTNEFLSSEDETTIERHDFTIIGDSLDYDKKQGKGILRGKVKMTIRNEFFDQQATADDKTATSGDKEKQETQKPAQTDEKK